MQDTKTYLLQHLDLATKSHVVDHQTYLNQIGSNYTMPTKVK